MSNGIPDLPRRVLFRSDSVYSSLPSFDRVCLSASVSWSEMPWNLLVVLVVFCWLRSIRFSKSFLTFLVVGEFFHVSRSDIRLALVAVFVAQLFVETGYLELLRRRLAVHRRGKFQPFTSSTYPLLSSSLPLPATSSEFDQTRSFQVFMIDVYPRVDEFRRSQWFPSCLRRIHRPCPGSCRVRSRCRCRHVARR